MKIWIDTSFLCQTDKMKRLKKILAKQDYDLQSLSEKIRLFYVALTRCRENMVLLNKKTTAQNKQLN